jgi:methanethiol S-methyltransferase
MFWLIFTVVLWGILHSLLASMRVKNFLRHVLGDKFMKFYRLLYNLFAVLSILPALYLMVSLPDKTLYRLSAPWNYMMLAGQILSVFFIFITVIQTDLLSFAGLRQLFQEEKTGSLVTNGLYHSVRHPLYTFSLLVLWLSSSMSMNSLIMYLALTVYILIGVIFEERKLLREFGQAYTDYKARTPMLIPALRLGGNK